ncbi:diguanylate cyclase [Ideonella sp. A 288]|uniref:GGDEF domain-containing protein n=1 Tax=Ideonella sp. A 288 TaxID=1962181 RepID=UPI000B4B493C|nr:GGDEF domain-containing protein [Ideonella sp. A 288]
MLHVDVLSGYVVCGAGSLVGAAMLRMAEANEPRTQAALQRCGWGFVTLGLSLLVTLLGDGLRHPLAQFTLTFGSLAGLVLIAGGLGQLQGRRLSAVWTGALTAGFAVVTAATMAADDRLFGLAYAASLAAAGSLTAWLTRGFITSPRDSTERALGAALAAMALSGWLRLGVTLGDTGPARLDLLYAPEPMRSAFGVLYGVLPMIVATLLLGLVNTRLRQQLRTLAITDELTGSMTRRALRELAPPLIEQHRQRRHDVAVMMLDLDRFKTINDTYGHARGDAVLQVAALELHSQLRPDALLARYGGEEFVAVMPIEDLPAARRVAERLRCAIADTPWSDGLGIAEPVTVSIGVAMVGPHETLDDTLTRADQALYRAKREGRDQIQVSLSVA